MCECLSFLKLLHKYLVFRSVVRSTKSSLGTSKDFRVLATPKSYARAYE